MTDVEISSSQIHTLQSLIDKAHTIGIATHTHPDGDAVGSSVGLCSYLTELHGRDVRVLLDTEMPETLDFLTRDCSGNILRYDIQPDAVKEWAASCDLLFFLDLNGVQRTGAMAAAFDGVTAPRVLIDHHLNPQTGEFVLTFSETAISSASELLFHVLMAMPDISCNASRLPMKSLTAMLTGLTTDTNNFANSTFPSTLKAASAMIAAGTDRDMILSDIYNSCRERRVRLMGELLYRNLTITGDGVAYMILDAGMRDRYGIQSGETEGFVNIPLTIREVRISMLLKEEDGVWRVSIRSKRGISANRLATLRFNGGGHEQASGGKIPVGPGGAAEAAAYIEKVTSEFLADEN